MAKQIQVVENDPEYERKRSYWRYTHFSQKKHDYGRKGMCVNLCQVFFEKLIIMELYRIHQSWGQHHKIWSSSPGFALNHGLREWLFGKSLVDIGGWFVSSHTHTHMLCVLNIYCIHKCSHICLKKTGESLISTPSHHDFNGAQKTAKKKSASPFPRRGHHNIENQKSIHFNHDHH